MDSFCSERGVACDRRFEDLRRFMLAQFVAQDKALNVAREELERATRLARNVVDHRLDEHNELREQLNRQAATLLDVKAYNVDHKLILKDIESLREWKARKEGERSRTVIISWVAVVISIISTLIVLVKGYKG